MNTLIVICLLLFIIGEVTRTIHAYAVVSHNQRTYIKDLKGCQDQIEFYKAALKSKDHQLAAKISDWDAGFVIDVEGMHPLPKGWRDKLSESKV